MVNLRFSKMQALGNDFVVFDGVRQSVVLTPEQRRLLADRHHGVGCDQILVVEPASDARADFFYRIYNADGSEAGQCGNGARCLASFIRRQGLSPSDRLTLQTVHGLLVVEFADGGLLKVDMGMPVLDPAAIPFVADGPAVTHLLEVDGESIETGVVSLGNPHAVVLVDDVTQAPVARMGPAISHHERFPERANVGFLEILDACHVRLRVYERGAGETLGCGSGACAAVVSGRLRGLLDERVTVELPGGSLLIDWAGEGHGIHMIGTAVHVFDGLIEL